MKTYLILILFFLSGWSFAQTIYTESETRMEGAPSMFAKMGETKSMTYHANEKTLIITEMQNTKATTLLKSDSVTYVNGRDCYTDSKKNFDEVNAERAVYENVEVEKNPAKKKILGYECHSATIKFKVKNGVMSTKQTMIVWYSPELKETFSGALPSSAADYENPLAKAMATLNGMVLVTEVSFGGFTTISEVKKIEIIGFKEEQFNIDTRKCKKMMTYKQFAEEMDKRDARSRGSVNTFPR